MIGGSKDSFNFTNDTPTKEFFAVVELINQLSKQQYGEIFNSAFILIDNPDLATEIDTLLYACSDRSNVDTASLRDILRVLLIISKEARRNMLTSGQLYSDMLKLKMDSACASAFCQAWKQNFLQSQDAFDAIPPKRLLDVDWKFGVTASSDALARVGNCYLQLKMVVAKGSESENVLMELSIPQFFEFMHEMEKAKFELDSKF